MRGGRVVVDLVSAPPVLSPERAAVPPTEAPRWTGVAVDVLRATSTLSRALANGAAGVVPFADTGEALRWRDAHAGSLACGERGGRIVAGFDLGNSPFEYERERVEGRGLAFASTNGSHALRVLARCERRWLGAFVSGPALVRALADAPRVWIACAGKEGGFAFEDAACAGWIVRALGEAGTAPANDAARLCSAIAPRDAAEVRALVEGCEHARVLGALGPEYVRDVAFCASLGALDTAYRY